MVTHHTAEVDGLSVFYREAGDPSNPKLLLLGGFPASSHQFRNLIPALADRFHVLSPDYPGFGNTDMPDPSEWDYTFDHLAEVVEALLVEVDFTGPMGIYMQDYGGPIGNRIIARHPDWLEWQVIQNSNSYEEGFTAAWDGIRNALWVDRSPETEAPLEAFLQPETVKAIYTTGHRDPAKISPDNWNMDAFFLARPECAPGTARPLLRLPHERSALPRVAGEPAREPAPYADPLGPGRHLLHPRGRRGLPARPARRRVAPARHGSLRGRGQPRRDHRSDRRVLRHEGASGRPGVGGRPVGRGVGLLLAPRRARALRGRSECRSSARTTTEQGAKQAISRSPLTDSNRRPPPYHRRKRFPCKSVGQLCVADARACPRVLNLLYPSRTRVVLSILKTDNACFDDQ